MVLAKRFMLFDGQYMLATIEKRAEGIQGSIYDCKLLKEHDDDAFSIVSLDKKKFRFPSKWIVASDEVMIISSQDMSSVLNVFIGITKDLLNGID